MNLNSNQNYDGPFTDIEEHRFYTVIPNLQELVPSLYSKKGEKSIPTSEENPEVGSETVDETVNETAGETMEDMEEEIEAMEQSLQSVVESEEKKDEEIEVATPEVSRSVSVSDLKEFSLAERVKILMDRLLQCYSSDDVDRWCLEFCDLNQKMTRLALVDTIRSNYRKRDHQPYFARVIRELEPAYEKLGTEIGSFVMVAKSL